MTLGGRGRLTAELISRLSFYYGSALRSHEGDVNAMHNAVMAVPFWRKKRGANEMQPEQRGTLVPVHKHLAAKKLLQWYQRGKIRNANESLHSVIWLLAPKDQNASLFTVETAVAEAMLRFNVGSQQASAAIFRELNLDPSKKCMKRGDEKDLRRSAAVQPWPKGSWPTPRAPIPRASREAHASADRSPSPLKKQRLITLVTRRWNDFMYS
ncbi:hypothetical protein HPB47_014379 [Ixodes persulcatus]|uniref:Uncharacterized protein n=1 Tax=Ixodes persulcatus TaxID=34615 RepID=A0AC60QW54_IXOPE|nr:hypothetical protein HPB47_014379 [Ixodes persulcatus]